MDTSILRNTKKILGIAADDTSFDTDIVLLINSAFSILTQLGVGPSTGFAIQDEEAQWEDFVTASPPTLDLIKTCVFLRVRLVFDPPQTSYLLAAMERQLQEHEWRLSMAREEIDWREPEPIPDILDFGNP